jgi:hypothetical protein
VTNGADLTAIFYKRENCCEQFSEASNLTRKMKVRIFSSFMKMQMEETLSEVAESCFEDENEYI